MTEPSRSHPDEGDRLLRVDEGPAVVVGAVVAEPESGRRAVAKRVAALVVAAALGLGGVSLAINALGSSGGSETPEAAVRRFLESLSAEDLLGAAEMIVPSERDTLIEGSLRISEQLIRLEALSPLLDLGSVDGIALRFDNLSLRSVPIHPDITQVFIDRGSTRASIDVSTLPLGELVKDNLTDEQLAYRGSVSPSITPVTPIAVVQRDGRWYVSLLYSLAEGLRAGTQSPPPSAADRLVPIGADSPEAAVERLIREASRIDPRILIGMLDPVEMSVLYDYAPVFMPRLEAAANEFLQRAADAGQTWEVTSVDLAGEVDGDRAQVKILAFEASFESPSVEGRLSMSGGRVLVDWSADNLIGKRTETRVEVGNGCTTLASAEIGRARLFDSCGRFDDQLGPRGMLGLFVGLGEIAPLVTDPADLSVSVSRVDGRWFVSPARTATSVLLDLLGGLDASGLDDLVGLAPSFSRIAADGLANSVAQAGLIPFSSVDNGLVSDFGIAALELVNRWAPSDFAMDLAPIVAHSLVMGWLPEAADARIVRAVEVISASAAGGTTVFVLELPDDEAVVDMLDRLVSEPNGVVNGSLIEMSRPGRDSVVVSGYGDRLVVATGLPGTPIEILRSAIAWQIPE